MSFEKAQDVIVASQNNTIQIVIRRDNCISVACVERGDVESLVTEQRYTTTADARAAFKMASRILDGYKPLPVTMALHRIGSAETDYYFIAINGETAGVVSCKDGWNYLVCEAGRAPSKGASELPWVRDQYSQAVALAHIVNSHTWKS